MKPGESRRGRKLRPGETPTIYLQMRQWSREEKRMLTIKGHGVTLRNYTPKRALNVMIEAFKRDLQLRQDELNRRAGELIRNR